MSQEGKAQLKEPLAFLNYELGFISASRRLKNGQEKMAVLSTGTQKW